MIADFVPDLEDHGDEDDVMPRSRDECRDGPRPCPYVSCRYHLLVDVTQAGSIRLNGPDRGVPLRLRDGARTTRRWVERVASRIATSTETCALDVAERGPSTQPAIARLYGITRQGVQRIEKEAMEHVRAASKKRDGHR